MENRKVQIKTGTLTTQREEERKAMLINSPGIKRWNVKGQNKDKHTINTGKEINREMEEEKGVFMSTYSKYS